MRRVCKIAAAFLSLVATGVIVFLALMPNPDVGHLHILPRRWSYQLDAHHNVRHIAGYFGFYLLLVTLGAVAGWLAPLRRRLQLIGGLFLLAASLELAQLLVPRRSVNFSEVLASWAGVALAFLVTEGFRLLFNHYRKPAPAPDPHVD